MRNSSGRDMGSQEKPTVLLPSEELVTVPPRRKAPRLASPEEGSVGERRSSMFSGRPLMNLPFIVSEGMRHPFICAEVSFPDLVFATLFLGRKGMLECELSTARVRMAVTRAPHAPQASRTVQSAGLLGDAPSSTGMDKNDL